MKNSILETGRLMLRRMGEDDLPALKAILQDAETMTAYEHAFSDEEVRGWLDNQLRRYAEDGVGLWAVCLKAGDAAGQAGRMIGQCGILWQQVPDEGTGGTVRVAEIGYLFNRAYWHRGYATEAAVACRQYAFGTLGLEAVCSIIRDSNAASIAVARRNGMAPAGSFVKHYYGVDMPHTIYRVKRDAAP